MCYDDIKYSARPQHIFFSPPFLPYWKKVRLTAVPRKNRNLSSRNTNSIDVPKHGWGFLKAETTTMVFEGRGGILEANYKLDITSTTEEG